MHTKGPWAIYGVIEGRGDISIAADRFVVATAHNGVSFFDVIGGNHPEQQWANARLIAAAPDLLAALRWYVENDDTNVQQDGNEFYTAGLRRAEAAIAKATGEQP